MKDRPARLSLICQFEENTAEYILHRGRALALADMGHRVLFLAHPFKYETHRKTLRRKGPGKFREVAVCSWIFSNRRLLRLILWPVFFLVDLPAGLLRVWRSDVVYIQKALPLGLLYLAGLRLLLSPAKVVFVYDDWEGVGGFATTRSAHSLWRRMLVTWVEEVLPCWSDGSVCVSRTLYERLCFSPSIRDTVLYLPNGGPLPEGGSAGDEVPDQTHPRASDVVYVGTYKNRDLVDFLVQIVEECNREGKQAVSFTIVGGGSESAYLEEQIAEHDLSDVVSLTGQIPHEKVHRLLISVPIALVYLEHRFPYSLIDQSRSSTKMFEYMAAGRAIVSSNFGEPANILQDHINGLLVENTSAAFARAILELHGNPETVRRLGMAAREDFVKNYSHHVLMEKFVRWVRTLK